MRKNLDGTIFTLNATHRSEQRLTALGRMVLRCKQMRVQSASDSETIWRWHKYLSSIHRWTFSTIGSTNGAVVDKTDDWECKSGPRLDVFDDWEIKMDENDDSYAPRHVNRQ